MFQIHPNFDRIFCKQTMEPPIRRSVLWVCTVCLCPTKNNGLYNVHVWVKIERKAVGLKPLTLLTKKQ